MRAVTTRRGSTVRQAVPPWRHRRSRHWAIAPVSRPSGTAKAPAYKCIHARALPFHWSSLTTPEEIEAFARMMVCAVKTRVAPMTPQVKVRRLRVISARTRFHRPTLTSVFPCTVLQGCGCTTVLMRGPPFRCGVRYQ